METFKIATSFEGREINGIKVGGPRLFILAIGFKVIHVDRAVYIIGHHTNQTAPLVILKFTRCEVCEDTKQPKKST